MNLITYSYLGLLLFFPILSVYLFVQKKRPDWKGLLFFQITVSTILACSVVLFIGGLFFPSASTTQTVRDTPPSPSPSPTSILTQEQQEYFRISANIRAGDYDHVLEDIHDLYPDFTTDDVKLTNRFILLRLYYEKTGDRKKEKQLLLDYKKNKELYNDDAHLPIRQIITERLAALEKE